MTDFITAYKDGIAGAEAGEVARREIDDVFADLNRQLGEETGGKLSILRKMLTRNDDPFGMAALEVFRLAMGFKRRRYQALVAQMEQNNGDPASRELAEWEQDPYGYPCTVISRSGEVVCDDREALEEGLKNLLKEAGVGEKLHQLLRLT